MGGTVEGGKAAAATNRAKHGADFYQRIGAQGGTQTHLSGKLAKYDFAADRERARTAGRKGGLASTRQGVKNSPPLEIHIETPRISLLKRMKARLSW